MSEQIYCPELLTNREVEQLRARRTIHSVQPSLLPSINQTLVLRGHCPSKKNLWQRGKSGRMFLNSAVKAEIASLTRQASAQWPDPPVKHPDIDIQFYTRDARPDRDNKLTTVLDCLRDAGVIKNDNIGSFNGTLVLRPAIIDRKERVVVKVTKGDISTWRG